MPEDDPLDGTKNSEDAAHMAQVSIPLKSMSVPEKLAVLERVWASLCEHEEKLSSPTWHKELLASRQKLVADGQAVFSDWTEAKERIRRKVRAS